MREDISNRRLVLCSGAQLPLNSPLKDGRKIIELDALDQESNVHLRLENVTRAFGQRLPDRIVDLLELATYVYCADCEADRGPDWVGDDAVERWDREFHFVMPVRDYDFWKRRDVREKLVKALNFLSSDCFTFEFEPLEKDRPVQDYLQVVDLKDEPFYRIERVVMFSGGLDSLAGAVESASSGAPLVLVSHRPVVHTDKRQKDLFRLLNERFPSPKMHIPIWVNKTRMDRESTQRTRSFLFSALGTAVAHVLEAGGVRFYENGIISLNWPLAEELLRSRASRTTHPLAFDYLEQFYRLVVDRPDFVLDNPYVFKTKTDVVSVIRDCGAADLIKHTCSCSHTMFQSRSQRHCGRCGQCIDRRVAVLAAGVGEYDPEEDYETDVFTGSRKTDYDHNIAADYARFARELCLAEEDEIGRIYNLELSRAVQPFEDRNDAADKFIQMHKRHGEAVCRVLEDQIRLHARELVNCTLDPSSFLAMVCKPPEHVGDAVSADGQQYPRPTPPPRNSFRRCGEYWTATFDGESVNLRDSKGLRYISILLKCQGQEIDVLSLVLLEEKTTLLPDPTYSAMRAEELEDYGLSVGRLGSAGTVMDEEYEQDLRRRISKLEQEHETAEAMGDHERAESAECGIRELRKALSKGIGLGGRRRMIDDPSEKARTAVRQAIGRALVRIREQHPTLYDHLNSSITTGYVCSYKPASPVDWQL